MSNRKRLPELRYQAPEHRLRRGRHRQPSRSVGGLIGVPGRMGVKFLAAGALGSAAMVALPIGAGSVASLASTPAGSSPVASLTADILPSAGSGLYYKAPPATTAASALSSPLPQPVPLPVPRPADIPGSTSPAPAQDAFGAGAQPVQLFDNLMPPGQDLLVAQPPAPAPPPGAGTNGPAPSGPPTGQPSAPPSSSTGVPPLTTYFNYSDGVGVTAGYTSDPSGQTGGYVTIGGLVGYAANFGVRAGTPAPPGVSLATSVTAIMGPATFNETLTSGLTNPANSSLATSLTYDGQGQPLGPGTGWSGGFTYTQNSDGTVSLQPRESLWGSFATGPQVTAGLSVTFPLPKDFWGMLGQAISDAPQTLADAVSTEAGLLPPQPEPPTAPAQPAPGTPAPTLGGFTLDQLMTPFVPSQGFPDPAAVSPSFQAPPALQAPPAPQAPPQAPAAPDTGQQPYYDPFTGLKLSGQDPTTGTSAATQTAANGASVTGGGAVTASQDQQPAAVPQAPVNQGANVATNTPPAVIPPADSGTDTNGGTASGATGMQAAADNPADGTSAADNTQQDNTQPDSTTMVTMADPTASVTTLTG